MSIIAYKKILITLSLVLMFGSALIIGLFGLNLGIDFTGGSLTEVTYSVPPTKAGLAEELSKNGFTGVSVRNTSIDDGKTGYIIRTKDLNETERVKLNEVALSLGEGGSVDRFTSIGPVIGQELKDKAFWAIAGVIAVIVIYVAFAFLGVGRPVSAMVYGAITIFVLIHDVLIPTALISLLGYFYGLEVDILFVTALLAILGYSVNDTIVVFDRVRENLIKYRTEKKRVVNLPGGIKGEQIDYSFNKPFAEIVGLSVSETLLRSFNTSFTTFLALLALYFVGGEATKTFALMLLAGVVAGTYSSIFFASPMLVWYAEKFVTSDSK